jgi:hypothetical protein
MTDIRIKPWSRASLSPPKWLCASKASLYRQAYSSQASCRGINAEGGNKNTWSTRYVYKLSGSGEMIEVLGSIGMADPHALCWITIS